jgi:ABC-type nitrate/sulfonate/bicarbonate transport system substrate-binding protein
LLHQEVYQLDMTAMVAGTQYRGQFESRMKGVVDDARRCGNIILVIDELHNIMGAGDAEGAMYAANILKPALAKGEIRVIVRSAELPLVKGHTVRVLIANKADLDGRPDVYRRFMRAYRETGDWMYASDEAPKIYAEFAKISIEDARRVREEFDPKEMLIPDRVLGLSDLVPDAVKFKYLSQPLTASQLDDLVQIPK